MMIHSYRLGLMVCAASVLVAAGRPARQDPALAPAVAALAKSPLRFETNQGQFAPSVRYAARTTGFALALTARGASLRFADSRPLDLALLDSNPWPLIQPLDRLSAQTDYFIGAKRNWHPGVTNYSRVKYQAVYPGIDVVYYGKGSQLEYDFVLQPGADPNTIRMQFSGAGKVMATPAGDLGVVTANGLVLQKKPVIYQQGRPVSGRYKLLAANVVGIQVDAYDRTQPLVIDPAIVYSTLIGGTGTDMVTAMKIGPTGLLYIAAWTQTGELLTLDLPYDNLTDIYVQVVDPSPSGGYGVLYATYLGGTNDDEALALDVDAPGFIYLTGTTTSTDFPVVGNSVQTTGAATTVSGFVSKIDPHYAGTGNSLVYSTYLGGTIGNTTPKGIKVGSDNMIYVVGQTQTADFPITDNAYAASLYGPSDVFISKIDVNNVNLVYSTFMGSELDDDACGLVLDANNVVYFAGTTLGTQFPMAGYSFNGYTSGNYDVVVGVVDTTQPGVNSLIWATYFGGSGEDEARGISMDSQGRVLVTGFTISTDLPVTKATAIQPNYGGNGDAFVAIFDPAKQGQQSLAYSTYLGGSQGDVAYAVLAEKTGYVDVTGYTLSPDFPLVSPIQGIWGGGIDLFLMRFNPAVAGPAGIDFSTYIGIDATMVGTTLTVDSSNNLYVGGYTEGYLPLVGDSWQLNYGGGYSDGFFFVVPGGSGPLNDITRQERGPRKLPGEGQRIIKR
ncbi:MAG: SBBP repeat-containing protein [Bryobacteraceae bacterium]